MRKSDNFYFVFIFVFIFISFGLSYADVSGGRESLKKISFKVSDEKFEGYVVFPSKKPSKPLPGVLFLQTEDETYDMQGQRILDLADCGYRVYCFDWKTEKRAQLLLKWVSEQKEVNLDKIAVFGAHGGGTVALVLACKNKNLVKAVVTVACMPPRDRKDINLFDDISCPVYIIHGEADFQIPISVANFFYFDLERLGKTVDIFIMTFSSHYFNDHEWGRIIDESGKFLNKYIGTPKEQAN